MNRPVPTRSHLAAQVLQQEGWIVGESERNALAAERVFFRLHEQLASLLGATGVASLFERSVRLSRATLGELPDLSGPDGAQRLREHLAGLPPPRADEMAVVLFGTFLDLVATFIGERLTIEILRRTWPAIGSSHEDSTR